MKKELLVAIVEAAKAHDLPVTAHIRISEIEILPEYLTEYNAILKAETAASVEKEKGV